MIKTIYLAGGCFWGVQEYYSRLYGVVSVTAGYANGTTAFPTYEEVKSGKTGHAETVKIEYEDTRIILDTLLEHYLRFVDPYSLNKQGEDEGTQYRTGIYYVDLLDGVVARTYLSTRLGRGYKIEIAKLDNFYKAEEYHQDYLKKHPDGYCHINLGLIRPLESKEIPYEEIAIACVDVYESLPEDEFTDLSSLVDIVTNKRHDIGTDELYEILPIFMNEISRRGIPLVMYKVPGPYNEPVYQRIRKIAKRHDFLYPTSSMNLNKPRSAEELVNEMKKDK